MRRCFWVSLTALSMMVLSACTKPVSAATIDLDAVFDTEGDGVIRFGDQGSLPGFVDSSIDYQLVTVTRTFSLTEVPDPGGAFLITISHYQSSLDAGYRNYIAINGHQLGPLADSDGIHWVVQTFSGNNSDLYLTPGANSVTFNIAPLLNLDDLEITDFSLTYDASPVPAPAALVLLGTGIIGLAGLRRKGISRKG